MNPKLKGRPIGQKHLSERIEAGLRRKEAWKLKTVDGLSYRAISQKLGVSHVQITRDIARMVGEVEQTKAVSLSAGRCRENYKLDLLEKMLMSKVEVLVEVTNLIAEKAGDAGELPTMGEIRQETAIHKGLADTWIKLLKRRAELNGYDVPVSVNIKTDIESMIRRRHEQTDTTDLVAIALAKLKAFKAPSEPEADPKSLLSPSDEIFPVNPLKTNGNDDKSGKNG